MQYMLLSGGVEKEQNIDNEQVNAHFPGNMCPLF